MTFGGEEISMRWEIKPFIGLGPITFGMTREQVARFNHLIGPVTMTRQDQDGTINEYRTISVPNFSYRDEKLIFISTGWQVKDVAWAGVQVYQDDPKAVLQALEQANGGALAGLGVVTFSNLGLDATGFYSEKEDSFYDPASGEQDDRAVNIIERESYNELASKFADRFKSISFLRR